ncbi:ovarian-specific serine/threonine-protein kinase Lok isoform X1 [Anopheles funestus]|uniref:ovarian-specific serine/threonine-protein kinase Lok isoform X1 n=1 Tax=Anopheles funestus TaxID=62324 RepID=UPI0020C6FCB9|nr:ovarian-specific serine/threonine-protein kinase Lok isoform X1 [Anopheles funestus]
MANSEAMPDTQTATQMTQDTALESQPIEHPSYGQLLGKHVKTKSLGTKFPMFYVSRAPSTIYELRRSEFKVGRDESCDLMLVETNLPASKLCRVSKVHFTIKKDLNDMTSPTYIHDHSRNGTYVNGKLIGANKCMILKHEDVIAIAGVNIRAFVYYDLRHNVSVEIKAKELLDRYHIGRKLGSGACGTVYLLHDTVSCQPYAMKHVAKDPLNERSRPKFLHDPLRVMNEVNIMKNLDHPCVIKMHDIVDKPDSVYMVLEYMKGGDLLSRIIDNKYLPEKTAKLFFLQMCHAVKYLHEQGITHRDLKPDNILLEDENEYTLLKVSDFGLSKFVRKNSVMRTICGTPLYVAPEVLQTGGRGSYTRKVDIWSLGVVLFTMLSGTLPFSDDYGSPAVEQIKRANFQMRHTVWKKVSPLAKKLIYEILSVNPNSRPTIEQLLRSTWLRDPDVVRKAERLMKIPLMVTERTPGRNTASDVENNNTSPVSSFAPPSKRKRL